MKLLLFTARAPGHVHTFKAESLEAAKKWAKKYLPKLDWIITEC